MIPSYDSFDWFSSLLPLLVVLVPVLLVVRRGVGRRAIFWVSGLYLLALVAPRLALLHLAFWIMIAVLQPIVATTGEHRHGVKILWVTLIATLVPMVAWKVWPETFVVEMNVWSNAVFRQISDHISAIDMTLPIVTAIGLSFSSFRAADLLIKSNLGLVDRLPPGNVIAYGVFPPLLVVGPIASYDEVRATLDGRVAIDRERVVRGTMQIVVGLAKVFVFAYFLTWSSDVFVGFADQEVWRLWIAMIAFTLFFYVNFAGYSDIAIGAGHLLGADLRPNFDAPFTKTDPAEFWNSWHISLTRFLRVNLFTAIVGRRQERQYTATMMTMLAIGLWHSITWASVVFGIYHGVTLVGHRMLAARRPPSEAPAAKAVKLVLIFAWFAMSLPLLRLDLGDSIDFYRAMTWVLS